MAYGDGMVRFEVDEITLRDIERRLGLMRARAPFVFKNALNATAKDARRDLANEARKTYVVKYSGFNSDMRLIPATPSSLEALIRTRGEHLEFKYFRVSGGRGGAPLSVLINRKHGGKKTLSRAFVNNIAARGQKRKKDSAKGKAGSSVQAIRAARRQGRTRLKINKLFSVSVPQMIGNEADVYGVVEPNIQSNLARNVEMHIAKILR